MVAHSCVLSWWEAVKGEPAPARYDRYKEEVTRGVKAATRIAAPTSAMMREVLRHYGGRRDGVTLENGHDPASFVSSEAEKEPIVLCVTRVWDEAKNVATLAKAAEGILWPVFVAGELRAPGGGSISRFDHVTLLGRIERPAALGWLARAAIFALPALYEPFGLSALEAACSGAALVLGDIPSLREIWGDAATYVPPRDSGALKLAVNALIRDDSLRAEMAARARQRGLSLSASRMAERYLDAYADLCLRASPVTTRAPLHSVSDDLGERTVS
jgi:glycosyltransferase involved in cell wall biosynthesis